MSFPKVIDLFNKMDYNTKEFRDEMTSTSLCDLLSTHRDRRINSINNVKMEEAPIEMNNIMKALFINSLADKFEDEKTMLIDLESNIRFFNKKDAENSVEQFIANLRYYSGHVYRQSMGELAAVVINVQDHSPLPYLGSILGSTLAAGSKVSFRPKGDRMLAVVYYIEQTMKELGFPEYNVSVYDEDYFANRLQNYKVVYHWGNRSDDNDDWKCQSRQPTLKYFVEKIPMLVFNSADLESASYSAIQAVWGFQGMMPWCVNNILVQEDVFADFVTLLKEKLLKVKIPEDISKPRLCVSYVDEFKSLVTEATKGNYDFWISHENEEFSPLIIVGDAPIDNNVKKPKYSIPFATILPFRNTKEAVELANTNCQGLAASVWAENIGLVNEVCRKLQVGTVWVNAHGKFRPDVSFIHQKLAQGLGYMNGIEGIFQNYNPCYNEMHTIPYNSQITDITEILNKLKMAQGKWSKLSTHARMLQLRKVGLIVEKNKTDFITKTGLSTDELDEWIQLLTEEKSAINNSTCDETVDIKSFREPLGAIALYADNVSLKQFIISAIADGNSLILLTGAVTPFSKMVKEVEKYFPGIIKCVDRICKKDNFEVASRKYIDAIFAQYNIYLSEELQKNVTYLNHLADCRFLTSKVKNIWYNFGDSFS